MDKLIFSQSGVYRLQQLATQVHHNCGVRYKLSNQQGMLDLLRFAAQTDHQVIRAYFVAFTNCLNSNQREALINEGVTLHIRHGEESASFSLAG